MICDYPLCQLHTRSSRAKGSGTLIHGHRVAHTPGITQFARASTVDIPTRRSHLSVIIYMHSHQTNSARRTGLKSRGHHLTRRHADRTPTDAGARTHTFDTTQTRVAGIDP